MFYENFITGKIKLNKTLELKNLIKDLIINLYRL